MKKKELKLALAQSQEEISRLGLKLKLLESGNRNIMGKNRELITELTSYKEFHDQAVALFSHMTKSSD